MSLFSPDFSSNRKDINMFKVCGKTEDNKNIISGVYSFYETHGLPLDILCDELYDRNLIPAWDHFYLEAAKAGVSHNKIINKIFEYINYRKRKDKNK